MVLDLEFLQQLINIDTTVGKEEGLIPLLSARFKSGKISLQAVKNRHNFLITWGNPSFLFSSHLDTVSPFFPFKKDKNIFSGRGSCDAKGQIFAQLAACEALLKEGYNNFGWLGVVGEETDSDGAKVANLNLAETKTILIGEPTDNYLISATKGAYLVQLTFKGKATHSGYAQKEKDATERFLNWANQLKNTSFPTDSILNNTEYTFSQLSTKNPMNVSADCCSCNLLFRTTFLTHPHLEVLIPPLKENDLITFKPMSSPISLATLPDFPIKTAAFTSDASYFTKIQEKFLFGPGSILKAHTATEQITEEELEMGIENLIRLFKIIHRR